MARANLELITALLDTAARLESGSTYKWSNYAACNCGNLVQTVTSLSAEDVVKAAFGRPGDWGEQARDYCPGTGYPLEFIFERLFDIGLAREDFGHLERLSDPKVRRHVGIDRSLHHTKRDDVVVYLRAWADLLQRELGEGPAAADLPQAAE